MLGTLCILSAYFQHLLRDFERAFRDLDGSFFRDLHVFNVFNLNYCIRLNNLKRKCGEYVKVEYFQYCNIIFNCCI